MLRMASKQKSRFPFNVASILRICLFSLRERGLTGLLREAGRV